MNNAIRVGAGIPKQTHHISLEDSDHNILGLIACDMKGIANVQSLARTPIVRTAIKMAQGNTAYSDYELPWTPIAQVDWSGGRGKASFDEDVTRFYDSDRINTIFGRMYLGPQETYACKMINSNYVLPGSVSWKTLMSGDSYVAVSFVSAASYSVAELALYIKRKGTPLGDLVVGIYSDTLGAPGTLLNSVTITKTNIPDVLSQLYHTAITATAINAGSTYWLVAHSSGGTDIDCWNVGVNLAPGTTMISTAGSTWAAASFNMYYRVREANTRYSTRFFQHKRAAYAVRQLASEAPTIWINGDRGQAASNTGQLTKLIDSSKAWTTDKWKGAMVLIVDGPGISEPQPWRTIISNDATTLVVDSAWTVVHTTDTAYIIINTNEWTQLTGHGLTAPITDVLTVNNVVYLAQGDDVVMRHMQWNQTTAVHDWADDGTNKAKKIGASRSDTSGMQVWKGNDKDGGTPRVCSVAVANVVAYGTNLTFGTAIPFNDDGGRITAICEGGDTTKVPWVFREGSIYTISSNMPDEIPLYEIRALMAENNGSCPLRHNVYMFFPLGSGVERYYNANMDDVGLNKDEGLPVLEQGVVASMAGYPGRVIGGVDAGALGYSSILVYNYVGWHNIYTSQWLGQRLTSVQFQVIPGPSLDRLWIALGDEIMWLDFPSLTLYPTSDPNYKYTNEGVLISGWFYAGMFDVIKFYRSIKIFAENLAENSVEIYIDWMMDTDTAWTIGLVPINSASLGAELVFAEDQGLSGKRFKYRMRLQTADNSKTPDIRSVVLDILSRVPVKYSFVAPVRLRDNDVDLMNNPDPIQTAEDKIALLDKWSSGAEVLTMRCSRGAFDNVRVVVDPTSLDNLTEVDEESYVAKISFIQI